MCEQLLLSLVHLGANLVAASCCAAGSSSPSQAIAVEVMQVKIIAPGDAAVLAPAVGGDR